jgi:hypothetical protein
MNIDAVILMPDSNQIEITREKSLSSENTIKLTLSFEVQTYYPAFRKPKFNFDNETLNGLNQNGQGGEGTTWENTNNAYSNQFVFNPLNSDVLIFPKKTKWYNNLVQSRERSQNSGNNSDPSRL